MLDYLDWQSSISLEQVFAGNDGFSHPTMVKGIGTVYLSSLKSEKSRSVLMLIPEGESTSNCITPRPFSLQTKVNEYGGKPYWVKGGQLIFANSADQCLYLQNLNNLDLPPKRISQPTDDDERVMFTDVHQLTDDILIVISERRSHPENVMSIAAVSLKQSGTLTTLIEGADFYSNLVIDQEGARVAWVQWQHPKMPWDANELWTAKFDHADGKLNLSNIERIQLPSEFGGNACVCQLLFSDSGDLFLSADFTVDANSLSIVKQNSSNFWNIYAYKFTTKTVSRVTQGTAEYGYPHWVYGDHRIVKLDAQRLLTVASRPEGDALTIIDCSTLDYEELANESATLQHLSSDGQGKAVLLSLPHDGGSSLLEMTFKYSDSGTTNTKADSRLKTDVDIQELSQAEHIVFPTRDGSQAFGFFYAPKNTEYQTQTASSAKPPLLVMVHGGPTARAYGHFDLQKQYWTSRGFAILDVNHRGSSGYGRRYRDALYGQWGVVDTQDIIDGIAHLVQLDKVDQSRVCIRGKSAGGYAVLRALTEYPDTFKAGACYYGIGNLVTLAETTHKFEKYYTDRLIDETFDASTASLASSRFYQRSPINKIDQVGSAMIVFQGSLDKVVPPSVAQEVVAALKASKLSYEYVEYPDEAHGFRQVANNVDAWCKELAFYKRELRTNLK